MLKQSAAVLLGAFLTVAPALAHEGVEHMRGTVTQITEKNITIKMVAEAKKDEHAHAVATHDAKAAPTKAAEHEMTIAFDQSTKFWNGDRRATVKDVKVGDRVVMDVVEKNEASVAQTVKFGSVKTATK